MVQLSLTILACPDITVISVSCMQEELNDFDIANLPLVIKESGGQIFSLGKGEKDVCTSDVLNVFTIRLIFE